jgi:hypothetical protein
MNANHTAAKFGQSEDANLTPEMLNRLSKRGLEHNAEWGVA